MADNKDIDWREYTLHTESYDDYLFGKEKILSAPVMPIAKDNSEDGWAVWTDYNRQRETVKTPTFVGGKHIHQEFSVHDKSWTKKIPVIAEIKPVVPSVKHPAYSTAIMQEQKNELKKTAELPAKPKKPRYPAYKKDDRVNTPNGLGNVWSVDKDGTVCVELDSDPSVLHEFEKKELKKIKK